MLIVILGFASSPSAGLAQEPRELFAAGSEAFAAGDFLQALTYFEQARDAGAEGPAVRYNIAAAHYRLGQYSRAEQMFRLVAERYPRMRALAEYNLGLVLMQQNRDPEARRVFSGLVLSADPKIAALAERALRRLDPASPDRRASRAPVRWIRLVDMDVGHDDNVALIDNASLPAGQSIDSPFTELVAVVSGPLSTAPGLRFDGSFYSVRYGDADEFDQDIIHLGGAYRWRAGAWRLEAGPHFGYSTLDGDAFEQRVGARLSLRRPLSSTSALGFRLVHDEVDAAESRFGFLDGSRDQIDVTWDRYTDAGRLTLAYQLELNDRRSASVSPQRNGISLRYRYAMGPVWATDLRLAFRESSYDDLVVSREEDRSELSLGFVRTLPREWQLSGTYRWFDNDSNVDSFSYTRGRTALGLSKRF